MRDAVLAVMQQCPAQSAPEARAWAAGRLLQFQLAAQRALAAQSIHAPVRVYLVNMYFPARRYPTGQLPAGRYDAVRIDIGSGGGRNWWCVLYPGLCSFAQGGYALPAENDLVCGQYILRFRLVDWAHRLTARRQTVLLVVMVIVFAVIFFCTRRYHIYKEGFLHNTLNRADFLHLNKLGWPIAMQMGMETASFSLSAIMVGWIGTTALAAHQVMLAISQICFMMYYGMGAAVAVRVSNFRGQNDRMNVRRSAYAGFHIMMLIALIGALPIFLLRNELGGWFSDSPAVSVMVAQLIIPFIIYQFGDGLQINFANALRGIADVKPMMYIAFIAYFLISLPAGYFFGFIMDWGIIGIWMAFPFGLTTAGILYYLRFNRDTK